MKTCYSLLLCLLPCLISLEAESQTSYQILDLISSDPVPFVKVLPDADRPCLSDFEGRFKLNSDRNTRLTLKSVGYSDTVVLISQISNGIIFLESSALQLEELKASPGVNPAERIMEMAITNRKKNNPTEDLDFTCDVYNKMIYRFDPSYTDSVQKNLNDSTFRLLSFMVDSINMLQVESVSSRKFKAPANDKETIHSYKVTGLSDPRIISIFLNMQSFHFYENQFQLMGGTYINPLAFGGINRYLFILKDTTLNATGDTTYTITFRPRKGKNFRGLKGTIFINTNGFAVEKVIASPMSSDSLFSMTIIQEYDFLEGKRWFPTKLSTEIEMNALQINVKNHKPPLQGRGQTYIRNVKLNPPLKLSDFDQISIETVPGAEKRTESDWDSSRFYQLSEKEKRTYSYIDTLAKDNNLGFAVGLLGSLSTGKMQLGYVNLDLKRIFNFNNFEGYRLGLGLETSDKLWQKVRVGGYFGYGFKDKTWKYGGFTDFNLHRQKNCFLRLDYAFDAFERGEAPFEIHKDRFSTNESMRRFYINQMDYAQTASAGLRGYLIPRVQFQLISSYRRVRFGDSYQFTPVDSSLFTATQRFDVFETGVELSWQFREVIHQIGYTRESKGSKFPLLHLKAVRGIKGSGESAYDYWRINTSIIHKISYLNYGKLLWEARAGILLGNAPLFLKQTVPGVNGRSTISIPGTFETLPPAGMYADRFAAIFFRYQFPSIRTPWKECSPTFGLHHAMGTGSMEHPQEHNLEFISMSKGYYEYGVILDALYNTPLSGIGVGLFNTYGFYAPSDWTRGLVFKLSLFTNL